MTVALHLVSGKLTDSVAHGFLPAAAALGLDVTVLTDRPDAHAEVFGGPIVRCDVSDFREILAEGRPDAAAGRPDAAAGRPDAAAGRPDAVFTNSDFLQAPVALAAAYLGLPGKDWRAAVRAKNKQETRRGLAAFDPVFAAPADRVPPDAPYPLVLKPREGVAGEDVVLVADAAELAARRARIGTGRPLIVEEYLPGDLHTLETLGDGHELRVLGSFRTRLSPPPHFVEERLEWAPPPPETPQVLAQLDALGVGFGACHTEFVVHEGRARIIEVNYRAIGDHCDFMLADLLEVPLFEWILRVHLGERLPPAPPRPDRHAVADWVLADRAGTLTSAPEALDQSDGEVRLTYRPLRPVGVDAPLTRTNRDYLGTIRAIGASRHAVEDAVDRFRAAHTWTIA
ncbi:siderophore biosynthesis protein [Spirillospora sp. NPDC052269]